MLPFDQDFLPELSHLPYPERDRLAAIVRKRVSHNPRYWLHVLLVIAAGCATVVLTAFAVGGLVASAVGIVVMGAAEAYLGIVERKRIRKELATELRTGPRRLESGNEQIDPRE